MAIAQRRLAGIDEQLATTVTATAAEDLGRALAALLPHVHTEDCPVCGRDYSEVAREPLSARLAERVSALGAEAKRLQKLAKARLEALSDLRRVENERSAITRRRMEANAKVEAQAIVARLEDARKRLVTLAPGVAEGATLIRTEIETDRGVTIARDQDRASVELRGAVEAVMASLGSTLDPAQPIRDSTPAFADHVASHGSARETGFGGSE